MNDIRGEPKHATPTPPGGEPSQPTVMGGQYRPDQLGGLRRFALAITVFNVLGHVWFGFEQSYAQPLVSVAAAYATQLLVDSLEAWAHRRRPRFANGLGALANSLLSAHISGLACAMLLYANERLWVVCFASAVAIASKSLFRMPVRGVAGAWPLLLFQLALFLLLLQTGEATSRWFPVPPGGVSAFRLGMLGMLLVLATLIPPGLPTRHYLNPSNFGIAVTLLLFPWVGIAMPYQFTENLGPVGDWALPMFIIFAGSLLNARYTRRIPLALAWVSTYALQAIVSSLVLWHATGYCPIVPRLSAMTGVAFLLFTFYMVTDPATTPERPKAQVAFGASVALVYMPISVPRVPISQGVDDLKARDMVLCRFPEVAMVVGKLGRAETPTDPAPLDMIETMVEFHPREFWPARSLAPRVARRQVAVVADALAQRGWIAPLDEDLLAEATDASIPIFDSQMREYAYQKSRELFRSSALFDEAAWRLDGLTDEALRRWREHTRSTNADLLERAPGLFSRIAIEEVLSRAEVLEPGLADYMAELSRLRSSPAATAHHVPGGGDHVMSRTATLPPGLPEQPELHVLQDELAGDFARGLVLWRKDREDLIGFGGELDQAVPMPGWTNVWTMPIQNRVDMLSTGVNTAIGIRVLGRDLDGVAEVSNQVADVVRGIPGAVDVVADPIRGKGVIEVRADRGRAALLGVDVGEINAVVEAAIGGTIATNVVAGRERLPVRVRYARAFREDEESVRALLVRSLPPGASGPHRLIPLDEVADVRVVDGPATIKGESGLPRNYVRLNVRGRDLADFVAEARQVVRERVVLPEGYYLEWAGQFEHELRARRTLAIIVPTVLVLIFGLLYWTYRDLADACLVMLAIPGAIAGGVICQWLFGAKFSVTVWIGYIACFGMATTTAIIMLVYLRDALERAGGIGAVDGEGLRQAVLDGAVQRLRPKLLTEATLVLGLAPMLWAGGVGGEVIRPMAAPVLGGILVADEVIDLFLPLLFYRVRQRRREVKLPGQRPRSQESLPEGAGSVR